MRLLHISTEKYWRGGEQQIAYLIEEQEKAGISNFLICRKNSEMESYAKASNIQHSAISIKNSIDLKAIFKIRKIFKSIPFDFIHLHSSKAHTLGLFANLLLAPKKFILHRRVSFPISINSINKWKYNHPQILKIICISEDVKKQVAKITNREDKSTVIYSAIDLDRFNLPINQNEFKEEFSIPDASKVVIGVGALSEEKDFSTFIKAAHKTLKSYADVHFLIVGDGVEKNNISDGIKELNIADNITLTGFRKDIPRLLKNADIFMLCSKSEGLGTSFIDAAAASCALLGSDTGGIPEIINNNENGFLAKPGNEQDFSAKLMKLLTDNELRFKMAENAKSSAKNFSITAMGKSYRKLYDKLLQE